MGDPHSRPVPKADGRDLGDEYLFYDRAGDRVHVLNETAREVFILCDGQRTTEEVGFAFAESHEAEAEQARRDAAAVLEQLVELGLIELE